MSEEITFDGTIEKYKKEFWDSMVHSIFPLRVPEKISFKADDDNTIEYELDSKELFRELREIFNDMPKEDIIRLILGDGE